MMRVVTDAGFGINFGRRPGLQLVSHKVRHLANLIFRPHPNSKPNHYNSERLG